MTGKRPLTPEDRLLLACSRMSLDDQAREEMKRTIGAGVNWEVTLSKSRREGVEALLYTHLKDLEGIKPQTPQAILTRMKASYQSNLARNLALTAHWVELIALLTREGVAVITHKGMALVHTVYPDIGLRPMADIDLLIHPNDLPAVADLLRNAGYHTPGETMEAEEAFRGYGHFVRNSTVVDLHWELAHYSRFHGIVRVDHEGLWKRARPMAVGEAQGLMFSPEDMLLHLALHVTLGSEFGRLIWYTDIDAVLRRFAHELDWDRIVREAAEWRVAALLGYTLQVCRESFESPLPTAVLTRLLPGRLRVNVLKTCIGTAWPPNLCEQVGDSRIYLAEALLMDRLRHVFRILWWSLFPPRPWVKFHYALTSPWQISLHQALHPFRVCYLGIKNFR